MTVESSSQLGQQFSSLQIIQDNMLTVEAHS